MKEFMDNTNNSNLGQKLILYIIFPFGTWVHSVFHAKSKSSYVVFFLFSLLLCWHMAPTNTEKYDDFIGILERFETTNVSTDQLTHDVEAYFSHSDVAPRDIYESILIWFVKLFTDNYHFFFLLASIPITLCQLGTMKFLTEDDRFENASILGVILLAMFIFPRDILTVQNPRFATGFWLCVMASVWFFYQGLQIRALILICLAPMCHSALLPFVGAFLVYLILPKNVQFFKTLAMLSIPLAFLDANLMSYIDIDILPPSLQTWASIYLSDEAFSKYVLQEERSGYWWVQATFEFMMKVFYIIMTWQLIKQTDSQRNGDGNSKLLLFYLFVFSFVNIIQIIPEMGSRYYWFLRVLCIFVWFKYFGFSKPKMLYLLACSCSFLLFMRYGYMIGGALAVTTSPDIFFTPLPYLMCKGLFWN